MTDATLAHRVIFPQAGTVEYAPWELSSEPPAGRVRVRTTHSLISTGTEITALRGAFAPGSHWADWVVYPFSPGYSTSGVIVDVGESVSRELIGRRVAARTPHVSLADIPVGAVRFIPDEVSSEDATWFGIANIVQIGVRRAEHRMGDAVVLVGMGLLGQLALEYVRNLSPRLTICVDTAAARLELARGAGADAVIGLPLQDAIPEITRLTDAEPADVIYDITGNARAFATVLDAAGRGTRVVLLSDPAGPAPEVPLNRILLKGLTVVGAHDSLPPATPQRGDRWTHAAMTDHFFTLLGSGRMDVARLVTHRFAAPNAMEAYELLLADRDNAMGVILEWAEQ